MNLLDPVLPLASAEPLRFTQPDGPLLLVGGGLEITAIAALPSTSGCRSRIHTIIGPMAATYCYDVCETPEEVLVTLQVWQETRRAQVQAHRAEVAKRMKEQAIQRHQLQPTLVGDEVWDPDLMPMGQHLGRLR